MESIRAYRFRVYPDFRRQEGIDNQLLLAKEFYNLLLEKSISSYRKENGKLSMGSLNKFAKEIEKEKKYLKLYSQARCEIKYRVMKAFQNFFRRVRERQSGKRQKAGFPRFKPIDRYKSITYPQDNGSFSIEKGRLRVSRIGTMKIELHREIEGEDKDAHHKEGGGRLLCGLHDNK